MKVQEVIWRTIARKITWWQIASIGLFDRRAPFSPRPLRFRGPRGNAAHSWSQEQTEEFCKCAPRCQRDYRRSVWISPIDCFGWSPGEGKGNHI